MGVDQDCVPLDGNAAAGLLQELFCFDVTAAAVTCGGCGVVAPIGAVLVYGGTMGAILRCAHCDTAVMRMVRTPTRFWFDMRGAHSLSAHSAQ